MRRLLLSPVLACVAVAAIAAAARTQAPADQPLFLSTKSELVVLPVVVTDRSGRFVPDLPQSAFSVRDNGGPRPVVFFSHEDAPVSVGLVIDNSLSMRRKMGEVIAAASVFARSSNPDDDLFVLAFNDEVYDAVPARRLLLASDVADLERALTDLVPEGQTTLYDAVTTGLDRLDEGVRARKVLIVISDGGDTASRATLDGVLERARRSDASIYTVGLVDKDSRESNAGVLASLARASGGERFLPKSPGLLVQACERIAHEIRSGYTVAYEPPEQNGGYRRIQVTVDTPDRQRVTVRTRPGYYAARATKAVPREIPE